MSPAACTAINTMKAKGQSKRFHAIDTAIYIAIALKTCDVTCEKISSRILL